MITPARHDALVEIEQFLPWAQQRFGVRSGWTPEQVLLRVEKQVAKARRSRRAIDPDDVIALGVLVGNEYVRGLKWHWAQMNYEDQSYEIVTDSTQGIMNRPITWVHRLVEFPDLEIAIALNYNMVAAGNCPTPNPAEPQLFE